MCRPSASMCTVQCNFMRGQKYSANSFFAKRGKLPYGGLQQFQKQGGRTAGPAVNQPSPNIYIGSKPFLKQIKDMCGKYILHQQKSIQKSPPVHPHSFLLQSFFFARFPASKLGLANLRLTVGRGSLRSISRPFFSPLLVIFLSFSDFRIFFLREILEREIF